MADDDLRINTLHRFAKHSPRLTLQEYSHCEVPAGCGGVVLRWINPERGPQACIRVVVLGTADTWLDGVPLVSDHTTFGPGRHVLAFHLQKLKQSLVAISVAADLGPRQRAPNQYMDAPLRIERWARGNHEGASEPTFDDRAWELPREAAPAALAALPADPRRVFERSVQNGLTVLELGSMGTPLAEGWLRIKLAVDVGVAR